MRSSPRSTIWRARGDGARSCERPCEPPWTGADVRGGSAGRRAFSARADRHGATIPPPGWIDSAPATRGGSDDAVLVLLDTTVLIDYLRGRPAVERVDALFDHGDTPCTSPVNVEEIVRGLRAQETSAVEQLFDGLRVIPLGRAEGRLAGAWRREFAASGTTLSQADCLIAAAARTAGAILATGNPRHFPMQGIKVEHWLAGG